MQDAIYSLHWETEGLEKKKYTLKTKLTSVLEMRLSSGIHLIWLQ